MKIMLVGTALVVFVLFGGLGTTAVSATQTSVLPCSALPPPLQTSVFSLTHLPLGAIFAPPPVLAENSARHPLIEY